MVRAEEVARMSRRTEAVMQNQHLEDSRLLPESRDPLRPYPTLS